jgi:excisionase family DNA binding protein
MAPAAEVLGVSAATVHRWAADGDLQSLRLSSNEFRFRAAAVRSFADRIAARARRIPPK